MKTGSHTFSRRDFLKLIASASGSALISRGVFSQTVRPFNMLVVGDSLISGQGLGENEKFYYLVKQWLETEALKGSRPVSLKVKAHSGASIDLRATEAEALKKAGIAESRTFPDEVNISFPSIRAQLDAAHSEYGDPRSVDLIMLSGGITDIRLSVILDPFRSNEKLQSDIEKYCNEAMFQLLSHTADIFPNALIAVVGYYPMLSKRSSRKKIFNHILELYDLPGPLRPLINNPLQRQLLGYYANKMIGRSLLWADSSAVEMKKAVARTNANFAAPRAVFIASPITEENSLGTKNSLLYELGRHNKIMDTTAAARKEICGPTLSGLQRATGLKFGVHMCEIASIGHPTPAGAKLIAEAIETALKPALTSITPAP
jgi:lysophospholipase L1-like esterase